jgi:hypothetical protein
MTKVSTAFHVLLTALCLGIMTSGFCQQQQVISTKRDSPIGLVSFGPTVVSGVLGEKIYVDGYIKKKGADSFIFPVGDNGSYRPFVAAADQTYGAYFQVDPSVAITSDPLGGNYGVLPQGGPFDISSLDKSLGAVSNKEYWDINGANPTHITLTWDQQSELAEWAKSGGLSKLTIVGWDGAGWVKIPSTIDIESVLGKTSTISSGSITSASAIVPDTYNVYTLGMDAGGALPVTLVSFKATAQEQNARLEWKTSQQINSSHFDIERSKDAKSWNTIGQLASESGVLATLTSYNFTDLNPLAGSNYYRLKMVDLDSTFAYSHITHLDFDADLTLALYPNPVSEKIYFKGTNAQNLQSASLLSETGAVLSIQNDLKEGFILQRISSGTYILNLAFKNGTKSARKIFIVQ